MKINLLKSLTLLTITLTFSVLSQASPLYCQLEEGYKLPDSIEFGRECYFTDMNEKDILWLVSKTQQTHDPFNKRYGFVNNHGEIVIPLIFHNADGFSEGLANVALEEGWGYIDTQGKLKIDGQYNHAQRFMDGVAIVLNNKGEYGLIDQNNKVVIPFMYEDAQRYYSTKDTLFKKAGKWGAVDRQNNVILPFKYDYVYQLESDAPEAIDWKYNGKTIDPRREYIFNDKGELIFPVYEEIGFFKEGLANVKKDGKWGFVDGDNNTIIDFIYDDAVGFFNKMALVKKDEKYGFINPKGEAVIPLEYDEIKSPFYEDTDVQVVPALRDNIYYLLKKNGETIQTDFDEIDYFNEGIAVVKKANSNSPSGYYYGLIDQKGEVVLALNYPLLDYDVVGDYRGLYTAFMPNKKVYVIDVKGNKIADKTEEFKIMMNY